MNIQSVIEVVKQAVESQRNNISEIVNPVEIENEYNSVDANLVLLESGGRSIVNDKYVYENKFGKLYLDFLSKDYSDIEHNNIILDGEYITKKNGNLEYDYIHHDDVKGKLNVENILCEYPYEVLISDGNSTVTYGKISGDYIEQNTIDPDRLMYNGTYNVLAIEQGAPSFRKLTGEYFEDKSIDIGKCLCSNPPNQGYKILVTDRYGAVTSKYEHEIILPENLIFQDGILHSESGIVHSSQYLPVSFIQDATITSNKIASLDFSKVTNVQITEEQLENVDITNFSNNGKQQGVLQLINGQWNIQNIEDQQVDSIHGTKIQDNSIPLEKIENSTPNQFLVTGQEGNIQYQNKIEAGELEQGCVESDEIQDGAITNNKLSEQLKIPIEKLELYNTVISGQKYLCDDLQWKEFSFEDIQGQMVSETEIPQGSIDISKIESPLEPYEIFVTNENQECAFISGIEENYLQDNCISTSKIQDGCVTDEKISNVNGSKILQGTIYDSSISPVAEISLNKIAFGNNGDNEMIFNGNLQWSRLPDTYLPLIEQQDGNSLLSINSTTAEKLWTRNLNSFCDDGNIRVEKLNSEQRTNQILLITNDGQVRWQSHFENTEFGEIIDINMIKTYGLTEKILCLDESGNLIYANMEGYILQDNSINVTKLDNEGKTSQILTISEDGTIKWEDNMTNTGIEIPIAMIDTQASLYGILETADDGEVICSKLNNFLIDDGTINIRKLCYDIDNQDTLGQNDSILGTLNGNIQTYRYVHGNAIQINTLSLDKLVCSEATEDILMEPEYILGTNAENIEIYRYIHGDMICQGSINIDRLSFLDEINGDSNMFLNERGQYGLLYYVREYNGTDYYTNPSENCGIGISDGICVCSSSINSLCSFNYVQGNIQEEGTTRSYIESSDGQLVTLSDQRYKENIEELHNNILTGIEQLKFYEYNFIGEKETTCGLIAQEVEETELNCLVKNNRDILYIDESKMNIIALRSSQQILSDLEQVIKIVSAGKNLKDIQQELLKMVL